jgi:hypothetical protein
VTAFAAIVSRRTALERDDYGRAAAALTAVYGTRCDVAAFDGCILLAASMVRGADDHLLADTAAGFAAAGQVLLEDLVRNVGAFRR